MCHILFPSYFLPCRDTSLFLTSRVNSLCFLAGALSVSQAGTTTSLPSLVFPHVQRILSQPSVPVEPNLHPCCAASLDSTATGCLYPTCSSSSLLLQRSTMEAQDLSSCLLASNSPLHVEASSWLCFFQLQIFLFFSNSFLSLSEILAFLSQLLICHHQCFPLPASSCLIFFSPDLDITPTSSENCCKDHLSGLLLARALHLLAVSSSGVFAPVPCGMCWGSGLAVWQRWHSGSASAASSSVPLHCQTPSKADLQFCRRRNVFVFAVHILQGLEAWLGRGFANVCIFLLELKVFLLLCFLTSLAHFVYS